MDELELVCLLEWRKFDWNIIKEDIHAPKAYAWKVFVIAVNIIIFKICIITHNTIRTDNILIERARQAELNDTKIF